MPSPLLAPSVPLLSMVPGVSNPEPLPGSAVHACSLSALVLLGQFCLKLWLPFCVSRSSFSHLPLVSFTFPETPVFLTRAFDNFIIALL